MAPRLPDGLDSANEHARTPYLRLVLLALALIALLAPATAALARRRTSEGRKPANSPLVIGHRGASGFLPEHTLQAYRLAIKLGADYIEPDVVVTKDGVLIARHEPIIATDPPRPRSTNVGEHPEFAIRKTTKDVDGVPDDGFASDFTLAEIKTLRAKQTRGGRPHQFNGQFQIPTLQEVINLAQRESRSTAARSASIRRPSTRHSTRGSGCRSRAGS